MQFIEAQLLSSFGRIADMKMCYDRAGHHNGKDDNATKISADERTECQRETAHHADKSHERLRARCRELSIFRGNQRVFGCETCFYIVIPSSCIITRSSLDRDNNTAQQITTDNIVDALSWRGPKIPSCPLKHNDNAICIALKEMKMLGTTGRRMISEMRLESVAMVFKMRTT
ncbi:hypothetical protein AUEXF2481DRAFT_31681 [Aureobasidium subglaciale EXF-2481]|uniref:Uncharacterized protein n=1 Tax=Aureobasidium subglaciale (strain EXF-2481) TaxID=1043005 RepID=A0A074Y518_AURSE|nr:uncharacterized protein AUEXF2481DRAFT_31681 [Aureobasidium subglaciale EXF-2481]KEQ92810.1 hypothetical protein AUEXF2481DRAFT_31681 [Aureobasidium subglaciale EXF-2481]